VRRGGRHANRRGDSAERCDQQKTRQMVSLRQKCVVLQPNTEALMKEGRLPTIP